MVCTYKRAVIGGPGDAGRRGALGLAGQGEALPAVQSLVSRHLLEGGAHVDRQLDVLPRGASGVGGDTGKHTCVDRLQQEQTRHMGFTAHCTAAHS